jgi:hypothetical protein
MLLQYVPLDPSDAESETAITHYASDIALATDPDCWVVSRSGSTPNWTVATGHTTRTTQTVGNRPVLPPTNRHFKFTM